MCFNLWISKLIVNKNWQSCLKFVYSESTKTYSVGYDRESHLIFNILWVTTAWNTQSALSSNRGPNVTTDPSDRSSPGNQSELLWIDRTKWSRRDVVLQSLQLASIIDPSSQRHRTTHHVTNPMETFLRSCILPVDLASIHQRHTGSKLSWESSWLDYRSAPLLKHILKYFKSSFTYILDTITIFVSWCSVMMW